MLARTTMNDAELAAALDDVMTLPGCHLHLLVDKFRALVFARDDQGKNWRCIAGGDFAENALLSVQQIVRKKRVALSKVKSVAEVSGLEWLESNAAPSTTVAALNKWIREKAALTAPTGRQGSLSVETKRAVERAAHWRCQFEGCGEDLRQHLQSGADGNFSYLAHIVAASPDGPRGDPDGSKELVDDPSNILLMCDKCHRLIDRIAPDEFNAERLRQMREKHIVEVNRLLDGLRFPAAQALVIGGNIAGQYSQVDTAAVAAAMRSQKLRPSGPPQVFFRNGAHQGNNVTPHYWSSLFEQLGTDLPALRRFLNGDARGGMTPENICVFPLHNTSILVLAGRVVGEGRSINIFQFDRDASQGAPARQWSWPDAGQPPDDKYRIEADAAKQGETTDAALLVYLTATIPTAELPEPFQCDGISAMPTVTLTVDKPTYSSISHPDDVRLFGAAVGEALRILSDVWRAQRIHVVVIAPVSACFRLGQKLQARNQPVIRLYERAPNVNGNVGAPRPFLPTIDILSDTVRLPDGTHSVSLL